MQSKRFKLGDRVQDRNHDPALWAGEVKAILTQQGGAIVLAYDVRLDSGTEQRFYPEQIKAEN